MKKNVILGLIFVLAVLCLGGCGRQKGSEFINATQIVLSDNIITVDGSPVGEDTDSAVYVAKDIVFYLEGQNFMYGEGTEADEHSQEEADKHTVLHITEPGEYIISGKLSAGQIAVDLGEDAEEDPEAVVTLILNGADITCTVAPAVIFYNVYECGTKEAEEAVKDVDTSRAGANVIIADGSENNISGSYVARIYKSVELNEAGTAVVESKKLHKYDGAFYAKMSMNVDGGQEGSGILNIIAENEGLDSELHLTINGGNIYITAGNDGINTNEDEVSVTTINGGILSICVDGKTGEGDGIDSNGWIVINGGSVNVAACSHSMDSGLDADMGIYINGGNVVASGNMLDRISEGNQRFITFHVRDRQKGNAAYSIKNESGEIVIEATPQNDFTNLVVSAPELLEGTYTLWQGTNQVAVGNDEMWGGMHGGTFPGDWPESMEPPEGMRPPEGMEPPEGMRPPEGMEPPEREFERRPEDGK